MTNTDRIEALEAQINKLTDAHRAVAARNEALTMVCRVMLPLIPTPVALKQQLLTSAYDALNEHMNGAGFDSEFQKHAREAVDEITHTILLNKAQGK